MLNVNLTFASTQILQCSIDVKRDYKKNDRTETITDRFKADVSVEILINNDKLSIKITQGEKILALAVHDTDDESALRFNSKNESDKFRWIVSNDAVVNMNDHRLYENTSIHLDRRTGVISFQRKVNIDYFTNIQDFGNGICKKVDSKTLKF